VQPFQKILGQFFLKNVGSKEGENVVPNILKNVATICKMLTKNS
jgi:hypothetical protein